MSGRLDGRVAIVTGAARGQGAAEARRFVEEGAAVVLGDVLDEECRAVAATLGDAARAVHLDVTSSDDWAVAADTAASVFGGLHVLVNNAGITRHGDGPTSVEDIDPAHWQRVLDVNLTGALLGIQACVGLLRATVTATVAEDPRAAGSIVNIASAQAMRVSAGHVAYASSKWGLRGLTKVAALELSPTIRVNAVLPGAVNTPMIAGVGSQAVLDQLVRDVPAGRVAEPDEIADLVVFLASAESSYSTGAEFLCEGGRVAGPPPPGSR